MFTPRNSPLFEEGLPARISARLFRRKLELSVANRHSMADGVMRVTLSGFDLASFPYQGGDQRCTLLIPWADEEAWRYMLPAIADPWTAASQYSVVAALARPLRRRLTVSGFRPAQCEIDFDIVLHGDSPLTTWARHAEIGSRVEMVNEGRKYRVGDYARWQLLIADESGTPAALAIANETPDTVPTTVYLARGAASMPQVESPGSHVTVIRVPTPADRRVASDVLCRAVLERPLPMIPDKVGIAGERALAHALSRGLQRAGVPRRVIQAASYWKK
ncbi:siderophore-interacting protein [Okibacterium endophyticum]